MHAEGVQGSILVTKVTHTRTRDERATAHQVALLFASCATFLGLRDLSRFLRGSIKILIAAPPLRMYLTPSSPHIRVPVEKSVEL